MRLRRLYLTRYGGFRDATLDLPRPDGPDVTVVLGPNEAGKSTAFSAWLDVLFGIATKTPAAWRFPRAELDIAADIETTDGPHYLRRLPTTKDNLRDADGTPVPESEIIALLHGLTRDGYRTRFSLDRDMLERGGEDIAGGKGDLGDLLFAGMAGLPGIQNALDLTQADADAFHRLGMRRTKATALGAALIDLKEADAALKTRLTPEVQAHLDAAVARAEADLDTANGTLAAARRALECERDATRLREIDADVARLDNRIAALPRCTWTPEQAENARAALRESERTVSEAKTAAAALVRAQADLDRCAPVEGEGIAASVLEALTAIQIDGAPVIDRLGSVNDGDLQRITDRREAAKQKIAPARKRFGLSGSAEGLADRIEPPLRAVAEAQADVERTKRAAQLAKATLASLPIPPPSHDTSRLRDHLNALRAIDLKTLRQARDAATAALEKLSPDGTALTNLPDPVYLRSQVDRYQQAAADLASAEKAEREASLALETRRRIAARIQQADSGADATAVEAARQTRDSAWQDHRRQLDTSTADIFATAMGTHDRLISGLAEAAVRAEANRSAQEAFAEAEALHQMRAEATRTAAETHAARDLSALAKKLGLPPDTLPGTLVARLDTLREIARTAPAAQRAEEALRAAMDNRTQILLRLDALLGGAADPEGAAEARLHDSETTAAERGRYENVQSTAQRAQSDHDEAVRKLDDASRRLELDRVALGLSAVELSDLPELRALQNLERADDEDARRQSALLRAREAAAPEIARLTELSIDGSDPISAARGRALQDRDALQMRNVARDNRDRSKIRSDEASQAAERAASVLNTFLYDQGGTGTATERVAELSEAAKLIADRESALREAETLASRHDSDLLAVARSLPPDPARLTTLADETALAEAAQRDAIASAHDARRTRSDAQGGDAAAVASQTRAAILADLGDGARRAAAALIGHMAGRSALSRLVQENRGPMVSVASDAFRRITCNEWDGLEVFGPDGMTLRAFAGERRSAVTSLSTGTQGQLFLALRVAGHAAFCARHAPLPFITDDILEAFDDSRTHAALQMAGEMGTRGQVVFFTHHDHIVTLAQKAIPTVSVIKMPQQGGRDA